MNKKVILIAVILILLLIGGYFFVKGRSASPASKEASQEQASSPTSLKDLISKGLTQSCTFSIGSSSGTVYVSGEKVRTDYDTTVDGKVTTSHMIVDGNTSYIWTEGQATGFKMTFDASASASPQGTGAPAAGFDAGANNNYKCSTWLVDNSLFTLPAAVKFTSFETVPGGSPAAGSNSSLCSSCDSLTGDSKTQCLTALKCN